MKVKNLINMVNILNIGRNRELRMDRMIDIDTCNQNSANDMEIVHCEYYEADWLKRLNKVEPRRGNIDRNRLRTYNQFKKNLKPEVYIQTVFNKRHCSALTKFRWCSTHTIGDWSIYRWTWISKNMPAM